MTLPNLSRFGFSQAESSALRREFSLAASAVALHDVDPAIRKRVPAVSGCYFWTMRGGDTEFKIYIGRTRSLRTRLRDYTNSIQIHAPNDY
jgi:hypothetical protein